MAKLADNDARHDCYLNADLYLIDDDTPRPPEVEPLASGQRKRYLRDLAPATGLHRQPHGIHIPKQTAATA